MFHWSNKRDFCAICQVSLMSPSPVSWLLPANHSSANNRAPLNPCLAHTQCLPPMSCIIISGGVTRAEPYTAHTEAHKVRANLCCCGPCMLSTGSEKSQDVSAGEGWWMSGKPYSDTQKTSTKKSYLVSSATS